MCTKRITKKNSHNLHIMHYIVFTGMKIRNCNQQSRELWCFLKNLIDLIWFGLRLSLMGEFGWTSFTLNKRKAGNRTSETWRKGKLWKSYDLPKLHLCNAFYLIRCNALTQSNRQNFTQFYHKNLAN